MQVDIDRLRAAAEKATKGPWQRDDRYVMNGLIDKVVCTCEDGPLGVDADHIAACDPTTIIALCDEVERLRQELGQPLETERECERLRAENLRLTKERDWWQKTHDDLRAAVQGIVQAVLLDRVVPAVTSGNLHAVIDEALAGVRDLRAKLCDATQRISDLKVAMGDEAGWFDRFNAERAKWAEADDEIAKCREVVNATSENLHNDCARLVEERDKAEAELATKTKMLAEIHARAGVQPDGLCGILGWIYDIKQQSLSSSEQRREHRRAAEDRDKAQAEVARLRQELGQPLETERECERLRELLRQCWYWFDDHDDNRMTSFEIHKLLKEWITPKEQTK